MSLDADTIVDRRRLRRKLVFWRVFAVLLAIAAVVGLAWTLSSEARQGGSGAIARVNINGIIRNDTERSESFDRLAKSSVKAVIVHIDSPGGTAAGAEQLHDSIRKVAAKKPTVVVVDGLAASGGYIAALAVDHIVAQSNSIVGSIGVIVQYPNFADVLKTIGVKVEEVKSAPLKASPNGFEPTSPEARAALEALVKDSYAWFKGLVHERRKIEGDLLERVSDGRVFTGRQALELKLVDAIGNEQTAIDWLAKEKGIDARTPVRDWKLKPRLTDITALHLAAAAAFDAVGLSSIARRMESWGAVQAFERLNLDGLLAVWHPSTAN
jgi:protease IV